MSSAALRTSALPVALGTQLSAEVVRVAQALGVAVPKEFFGVELEQMLAAADGDEDAQDYLAKALAAQFATQSEAGKSSMTQDVLKGRRTEIEYLNGLVAQKGREVGVATPASDAVVAFVQRAGVGKLEPDVENLSRLAAELGIAVEAEAEARL